MARSFASNMRTYYWQDCGHEYTGDISTKAPEDIQPWPGVSQDDIRMVAGVQNCIRCSIGKGKGFHWACGHAFTGNVDNPALGYEEASQDLMGTAFARAGVVVTHPRWCQTCINRRSTEIRDNHLFVQGYEGRRKNDMIFQIAWSKGIRDGRIEAESTDWRGALISQEEWEEALLRNPTEDQLLETMMGKLDVGHTDPRMQELIQELQALAIIPAPGEALRSANQRTFLARPTEFKLELAHAYKEAKRLGVAFQCKLEFEVLHEPEGPRRDELLNGMTEAIRR